MTTGYLWFVDMWHNSLLTEYATDIAVRTQFQIHRRQAITCRSRPGMGSEESATASTEPADSGDRDTVFATRTDVGEPSPAAPTGYLERGGQVGRYLVLGIIGRGAMGVVYRAHDPELDREIALKLLRDSKADRQTRLAREAQALARLNHPNVVTGHDVGTVDGRLYVAMELVKGTPLDDWQEDRPWREVVDVYLAAGRGLVAAHAQGLVHRDFKPDNVLVSEDGVPRVLDFGLARAAPGESPPGSSMSNPVTPVFDSTGSAPLQDKVTRAGAVVGTPAYMSPEQWCGLPADAAADQYSFCASQWEGLFGRPPYSGASIHELRRKVVEGKHPRMPAKSGVPSWVVAIVQRGLAHDPEDRWPSMQHLLDALADDPARRRRRWVVGGVVAAVIVAGVLGRAAWYETQRKACEQEAAVIDEVWSEDARARVSDVLSANAVGLATVLTHLDDLAEQHRTLTTSSCVAHRLDDTRTAADHELVTQCLAQRRYALQSVVSSSATDVGPHDLVTALVRLEPPTPCEDLATLHLRPAPPTDEDSRDQLDRLQRALARAATLRMSAPGSAIEIARGAVETARGIGWEPGVAQAYDVLGSTLDAAGKVTEAEEAFSTAYFAASASGDDVGAARAAMGQSAVLAQSGRPKEALHWSRLADVHLTRVGQDQSLIRSVWLSTLGKAEAAAGNYAKGREHIAASLDLRRSLLGDRHVLVAGAEQDLGVISTELGDYEAAATHHRASMELLSSLLGPEHPSVAKALANIATVEERSGDRERARELRERALVVLERAFGPNHPALAQLLISVGLSRMMEKEFDVALESFKRAVEIRERVFGEDNPEVAEALLQYGLASSLGGNPSDAVRVLERALEINERALGRDHAATAQTLSVLASALSGAGRSERARERLAEAIESARRAYPPGHHKLGAMLMQLGQQLVADEQYTAAVPVLEECLAIFESKLRGDNPTLRDARELLEQARKLSPPAPE